MSWGMSALGFYGSPGQVVQQRAGGGGVDYPAGQAPMEVPKMVIRYGEQAHWSANQFTHNQVIASTQQTYFNYTAGGAGGGFATTSLAETSMEQPSTLGAQKAFDVWAISCQLYNVDGLLLPASTVRIFHGHCVVQWRFSQAVVRVAPGVLVGAGGGIYGSTADTGGNDGTGGSRELVNNGNGGLWVYQHHPVILAALAQFNMETFWGVNAPVLDAGGAGRTTGIRLHLLGRYKNAIDIG